jgi:hypothetical protein
MTPDFPSMAGGFAAHLHRLRTTGGPALHQFEALFAAFIPDWLLAQQDEHEHSRDRCWNLRLVFWSFLWQVAQVGTSCREAIRQAQALCLSIERRQPPDKTSPYCQARSALPLDRLEQIHNQLVTQADAAIATKDLWCGHRAFAVDGSTATAPDTPENQNSFPQQSVQKPGCGFPIIRIVAFLSLATGLLTAWATGTWHQHELTLLQTLWEHLRPGDVLLGDRGFCTWGVLAQCLHSKVHGVFRVRGKLRSDFRRGQRLSRHERLVQWRKPTKPADTISPQLWAALPEVLTLRLVRCRIDIPGFRTRQILLVTTLLDSQKYSPAALGQLYYRRWSMELTLRNLKTTLQMEHLSCKTPANLEREIRMHFLVHNLVRHLMLQAARRYRIPLDRVSFAGALATARRYGEALLQARSERSRRALREELLRVIAEDLVPDRPGRREPRAVKRRPKPYPRLMSHRSKFQEISHQNRYYKKSIFGPKYRK